MNKEQIGGICFIVLILSIFGGIALLMIDYEEGYICRSQELFNNDSYCYKTYSSNWTGSGHSWERGSHESDRLRELARQERVRIQKQNAAEAKQCYDNGYFVNESFNISDYGFNCNKIAYLNDHLMDNFEKKSSGYIRGSYSGFLSSGSINGESYQYINDRVLATGMLIENINYQIDCNDIKHDEKINYYTEEEFVMFYVEECIA